MRNSLYRVFLGLTVVGNLAAARAQVSVPSLPNIPAALQQAAAGIDPEKIRAHVKFLADDLLEGRGPGKRGAEIAAQYIATQFAIEGLKPAGDQGTYFQKVPLYAVHTVEDQTSFSFVPNAGPPIDLKYGEDVVTKDTTGKAFADIDAPIVFVGYGIDAPEYQWNDFAGADVKGKVLLVIVNEPPSTDPKFFKAEALTYYGRWTYKYEQAARLGAAGVLIIHRTDLASYPWDVVRNSQAIEKSYLQGDPAATLRAASWIQHGVADKLLASIHMSADQAIEAAGKRGFKPIDLPVRLKAHIVSKVRRYDSDNVVAMIPGTAPGNEQAVIYSAHYDHLGIDPDAKGDGIYNGANDNGTGCGILLEMARAWTQVKPPHPIYFAAVTAEEQGLLGSQYLGMHPPVPASQISLDLNYDALLPVGIPTAIGAAGSERTSFYPVVESTAKAFGLTIQPDQQPLAGHYYRSDHFSFARVGVPAFSIEQGTLFEGQTPEWGKAQSDDYVAHRYHQPSDEYRDTMDFRGNAKLARFGFILGWEASSLPGEIQWQSGDEFEKIRKTTSGN
ncbi:peptidase M28 [Acidisarcina polymorpha]|uniref:Peptidase M28 n=1 Tax=Acidisarcina polymorpha TaxID=2211140 RepID=A0A2Z5FWT5_9BACT|nr:M28 family peptidase [Acidisarcina polymorpha]AXC11359.1 peptidase M28 [Acidisarcina polymorpha]